MAHDPDIQAEINAAAVAYAERGWPVLVLHGLVDGRCTCSRPTKCKSPGKHPASENGLDDASKDPATVASWFRGKPRNVGLVCGIRFDVLDVDGLEAGEILRDNEVNHGFLPKGPSARTGRDNGVHIFFQPGALHPRANKNHLDWRGPGSYIVAPPSLHLSGRQYRWVRGFELDPPPAPQWLINLLNPQKEKTIIDASRTVLHPKRYAERMLERVCDEIANAPSGMRNDTLNTEAYKMRVFIERGNVSAYDVVAELLDAAAEAGLGEREAQRTIRSALGVSL